MLFNQVIQAQKLTQIKHCLGNILSFPSEIQIISKKGRAASAGNWS